MATLTRPSLTHDEYKAYTYVGVIAVVAAAAFGLYLFSLIQSAENLIDLFGLTGVVATASYLLQPIFTYVEVRLMPFVSKMPHASKFFPIWAMVGAFDILTTYWGLNHWAQTAPFMARLTGTPVETVKAFALSTVSQPVSDTATIHIAVSVVCFIVAAAIAVGFEYLLRLCVLAISETIKATW